jgi:outer membrane protein OmpA-like peptidoglycan-associated protein
MAEDWLVDVRKWAPNADEGVVGAIVKYCGIALQTRDGQLVAMSDKKERELVRENYLKKKLGLTQSDETLDEAVLSVGQHMKSDRTKNRVTVYYLLAEHFGALNVFGGAAGTIGAAGVLAGGAAALMGGAATSATAADPTPPPAPVAPPPPPVAVEPVADTDGSVAPLAAAGLAGTGLAGAGLAGAAAASMPEPESEPAAPAYAASSYDDGAAAGGGMGWLKWLLLALLLGALIFFGLKYCSKPEANAPVEPSATAAATEEAAPAAAPEAAPAATAEIAPATAAPEGSGVVASTRDGKPMLTVYFDQAKTNLPTDFDKVAAVIKDYAAKNPGAKFAVSGFNSPTGSAAGNERLSKGRAENVGTALQKLGVSAGAVELVKPASATQGVGEDAKARRVEVTVK